MSRVIPVPIIGESAASGAQVIDGSLKFDGNKSTALKRTPSSLGNTRTWTWSAWVRKHKDSRSSLFSAGATSSDTGFAALEIETDEQLRYAGWSTIWKKSTEVFRDYNQFYHIVLAFDSTQGTASNRVRMYKNGTEITDLATNNSISQNTDYPINDNVIHYIGGIDGGGGENLTFNDFTMTQVYLIDGQQLGPDSFGFTDPLTNTWRPKKFTDFPTPVASTQLLYNVNTSDSGFDSSSTSRTYDAASRTFSTYTTPQTANPGGNGANSAHVYKSPTGSAITWVVSTDTTDRYIWTSSDGTNWSSTGSYYDTDSSPQSVTAVYIALAGGSNSSNVTVTSSTSGIGQLASGVNSFYLPMDGNSPIGEDKSGLGNNWTPVNFGGSNSLEKATGALPILNTVSGGNHATVGVRTDAFSSNLKLAVDHAGSAIDRTNAINGNTNLMTSFTANNSTYASTVAGQGSPYSQALYISGTGDYPRINFTAGDFNFMHNQDDSGTVEFWFYNGAYSTEGYLIANVGESSQVGLTLVMASATSFNCYIQRGVGGDSRNAGTSPLPQNKWSHVAVTKQKVGSNVHLKVYVDGVNTVSNTSITATDLSNSNSAQNYWQTGSPIGHESSRGFTNAYINDIRIYNTVKYTSNFIPASTSPDIRPDTPSGVSGGSKLTKITDGAVSFDGNSDYLDAGSGSDYQFGTGDFTFEGYFYANNFTNRGTFIDGRDTGNTTGLTVGHEATSGQIRVYMNASSGSDITVQSDNFSTNKWTHVAVSRDSGTVRLFVDGILQQSATRTSDLSNTNNHRLGYKHYSSSGYNYFDGFMSNVRIIKGTALYTSNFTPPISSLTNVTNTKLLCCQSNTSAGSAAVSPNITGSVNTGTVWSDLVIGTLDTQYGNVNRAWPFNGSTGSNYTDGIRPDSGRYLTMNFGSLFSSATSVKIYGHASLDGVTYTGANENLEINGTAIAAGAWAANGGGAGQSSATFTISGLTSLAWGYSSGSQSTGYLYLQGIEVDGTLLVNPVTPLGDAAATTFNSFNTDINTVRGQETSYCTLNPLFPNPNGNTLTDGNLKQTTTSGNGGYRATTLIPETGSWYWEVTKEGTDSTGIIGIADETVGPGSNVNGTGAFSWYIAGPRKQTNGVDANYGGSVAQGDVVGVAYNADIRELRFYLNGADQGVAFGPFTSPTIPGARYFPAFSAGSSSDTFSYSVNFGQKPFRFPPPDGFQPLNAVNVRPDTVIARPDQFVGVTTFQAPGSEPVDFDVFNFQPDLLIGKSRTNTYNFEWVDSVTGGAWLKLSNSDAAATEYSSNPPIQSFNSSGFTASTNFSVLYNSGDNPQSVVWGFKAGGNKNTFNIDDVGYSSASDAGLAIGSANSSAYNTSETWSTASDANAKAFDGSKAYDSGANRLYGNSTLHTAIDAATTFTNVKSVVVGVSENSGNITIDGVPYTTTYISAVGLTVTNPPPTVKKIEVFGRSSGLQISYVQINGVLLVDNGVSVTNVPSIAPSSASIGTKNGFSIVKYVGNGTPNQSLPHGLSQAPDFVIIKNLSSAYGWAIYHKDSGLSGDSAHNSPEFKMLAFSTSAASNFTEDCIWDVFDHSLRIHRSGNGYWLNDNTSNFIMYSWHSVPGLQKFGKYVGTGFDSNNKEPFIELGFRPKLIWIKSTTLAHNWVVFDSERGIINPVDEMLFLNENNSEAALDSGDTNTGNINFDILSNGFKLRTANWSVNKGSSDTYIYCAWAETPLSNLYGAQSNAR